MSAPSKDLSLGEIARIQASLEESGDDASALKHRQIAELYVAIGESLVAASWYLRAARHSEQSDQGYFSVSWAKRAVELGPESTEAREAHAEYDRRFGLPKSSFVLPESLYKPKKR